MVLLPLCAGVLHGVLGRRLAGGGWIPAGALLLSALGALLLLLGTAGSARAQRHELRLSELSPHQLERLVDAALQADGDGDDALRDEELGAATARRDRDLDGVVTRTELEAGLAERGGAWLALGDDLRGLRLPLVLRVDRRAACLLLLLSAGLGLLAAQLAGGPGDERSPGWLALGCGGLLAAALADDLLFACAAWEAVLLLALLLQHGEALDGGPNRIGAGTLAFVSLCALALFAALILCGDPAGGWDSLAVARRLAEDPSPWRRGLLGGAALLGLFGPVLLALRQGSGGTWLPAQGLYLGLSVSAILILARVLGPGLGEGLLALLGGGVACFAGGRALGATRLDRTVAWTALGQLGALLAILGLGGAELALLQACTVFACLLGLFLAADAMRAAGASWELSELGGLRRTHPWLAAGWVASAAGLAALPPLPAFLALQACGDRAGDGPGSAFALGLVLLATVLAVACLLRVAALAFRGPTRARVAAAGGTPLPLLILALLGSAGVHLVAGLALPGAFDAAPARPLALLPAACPLAGGALAWLLLRGGTPPAQARWTHALRALDARLSAYAPQRRLVQPLLALAHDLADLDRRVFEEGPLRLLARLRRGEAPARPGGREAALRRDAGWPLLETALWVLLCGGALLFLRS